MLWYNLILIMHGQFCTQILIKHSKLNYKCFKISVFDFDDRAHVGVSELEKIYWLPVDFRLKQCLSTNFFKFFDDKCPLYMEDVFDKSSINQAVTRYSNKKISQPLIKSNFDQNWISFMTPTVWNNMPSDLTSCRNVNT